MSKAIIVLVALFALLSSSLAELPKGTEFVGKGFDVTKGNLKPTSVQEVDTSFGNPNIFTAKVREDIEYTNLNAGQFSISSKEVTTIQEVTHEFSQTVSVSGGFKGVSASASTTVRNYNSRFTSQYVSSFVADSIVSVGKIRLLSADFNTEFADDLKKIPSTYNKTINGQEFAAFINKWGTHYIVSATVGGRTTFTSFVTQNQLRTLEENQVNVKVGVEAAFKVSVGVETETQIKDTNYKEVTSKGVEINAFAVGGAVGLVTDYTAWSASVVENPMPIFAEVVPYVYLIEDLEKREALKLAIIDYILGTLNADNTLELKTSNCNTQIWTDAGSGASMNADIRRPCADQEWRIFGDSQKYTSWPSVRELAPPKDFFSIVSTSSKPLLARPTNYELIWNDAGSGADRDGSFWKPICPENYNSLADVTVASHAKPSSVGIMTCVHVRCLVPCSPGVVLWSDSGSGADRDVSLWSTLPTEDGLAVNGFTASQGYGMPSSSRFFCLKKRCVAQPLDVTNATAEVVTYVNVVPPVMPPSKISSPTSNTTPNPSAATTSNPSSSISENQTYPTNEQIDVDDEESNSAGAAVVLTSSILFSGLFSTMN